MVGLLNSSRMVSVVRMEMCEVSELVNANELSFVWCISVIGRMDRDMGMGMD